MDILPEQDSNDFPQSLSYDENVPYEEQTAPAASSGGSLAERIGKNKLYLYEELPSNSIFDVKPKGKQDDAELMDEDELEDTSSLFHRPNALLLKGTPISNVSTARIFSYAKHFDTTPMGLEWVDDTTCVLVFSSQSLAKAAYRSLQKSVAEEPDEEDFVSARPIPISLWSAEERINKSLGKGDGLRGLIKMRWARSGDVKKKGAQRESEFYKKHGLYAGKELPQDGDFPNRREDDPNEIRRELDAELDSFLAEGDEPQAFRESLQSRVSRRSASPPRRSKLRSDDILENRSASPPSRLWSDRVGGGKSLLERTSSSRAKPSHGGRWSRPRGRRGRTEQREHKSQKELDDELEAFLSERG